MLTQFRVTWGIHLIDLSSVTFGNDKGCIGIIEIKGYCPNNWMVFYLTALNLGVLNTKEPKTSEI